MSLNRGGNGRTCEDAHRLGEFPHWKGQDHTKCSDDCDKEPKCKFYFYNDAKSCVLYSKCDQYRTPAAKGDTFEKVDRGK